MTNYEIQPGRIKSASIVEPEFSKLCIFRELSRSCQIPRGREIYLLFFLNGNFRANKLQRCEVKKKSAFGKLILTVLQMSALLHN